MRYLCLLALFSTSLAAQELYEAARQANVPLVRNLLAKNPVVDVRNAQGRTPLMAAAFRPDGVPIVEALLESGADPNLADKTGATALMYAAYSGNQDIVEVLLRNRADPRRALPNGLTAADIAAERGHEALANFVRKAALQGTPPPQTDLPVLGGAALTPAGLDRPYVVLKVLSAEETEKVARGDKKWPDRQDIEPATKERLYQKLLPQAKQLGADELIIKEGYTVNRVEGGSSSRNWILAGIFDGLSDYKYERTAPRLPGNVPAQPPVEPPAPLPGSHAPLPGAPAVEHKHTIVAFAVKYRGPGVSAPAPSPEESALWRQAQETDAPSPYRLYLRKYPHGSFADLARIKVPSVAQVTVWVYRMEMYKPTLFVNNDAVARIGERRYVRLQLDAGATTFVAGNKSQKSITLDLKPGQEYYLRTHLALSGDKVLVVDAVKARQQLAKCQPVESKWVQDPSRIVQE